MLPYHGLVRPCLRFACSLRLPFGLICSALVSPPRRRRLAVSFMDRSSPPSGRLAAVRDRCLRFAHYGLMESLYRAPCLHCAGRASLRLQLIPYPRYTAAPSHTRCAPALRSTPRLPSLAPLVHQGDTVAQSATLKIRATQAFGARATGILRTVVVWYLIYPYITTPRTRQEEGRLQRSCIGLLPTGRGALGW